MKNAEQIIAIRVDASSQIGTGHFMRCLTLADSLKANGARIRFVCRHLPEHLRSKLAVQGHEFVLIGTHQTNANLDELAHASWLGVNQAQDAIDTISALSDINWDWLIVDHYALDVRWESKLRKTAKKILVIDDIADRKHDCDILLDQNFYEDMQTRYSNKVPEHCQLLLGPRYALLRDEFRRLHDQVKIRTGSVRRVLVFFGGIDADNYTGRVIEALSGVELTGIQVDVVIGAQHPLRESIVAACAQSGFVCHVQTDKMAELMAAADLAIGAGGSACWERCCLGLPALLVALAKNQINIAKGLDSLGASIYIGTPDEANLTVIRRVMAALMSDDKKLRQYSSKAFSLVDGLGANRICQKLSC